MLQECHASCLSLCFWMEPWSLHLKTLTYQWRAQSFKVLRDHMMWPVFATTVGKKIVHVHNMSSRIAYATSFPVRWSSVTSWRLSMSGSPLTEHRRHSVSICASWLIRHVISQIRINDQSYKITRYSTLTYVHFFLLPEFAWNKLQQLFLLIASHDAPHTRRDMQRVDILPGARHLRQRATFVEFCCWLISPRDVAAFMFGRVANGSLPLCSEPTEKLLILRQRRSNIGVMNLRSNNPAACWRCQSRRGYTGQWQTVIEVKFNFWNLFSGFES
jgi:hypothetical protein